MKKNIVIGGLTPVERLELARGTNAAPVGEREAFEAWCEECGQGQGEDATIRASLCDFITRHGDALFSELGDNAMVRDRAGWWKNEGARRVWLFTSEGLGRAVPGFDLPRILAAVEGAGWITEHNPGKRAKRVKVDGRNPWLYHLAPLEV